MKREEKELIYDYCFDVFPDFLSDFTVRLKNNNSEYKELIEERRSILKKCPKLEDIIENNSLIELSKEESNYIYQYYVAVLELVLCEEREIFFEGMCQAYDLFKRLGIIK